MSSVESILDVNKLSEWIGLQTESSKKSLNRRISEWIDDPKKLGLLSHKIKRFKQTCDTNPDFYSECNSIFKEISECEKNINQLIKTSSDLEKESYNELIFFRPILQPLNFISFILPLWSIIRVYIFPALSFIIPFIALISPYIILKFIFHIPITLNNYINILQSMISGNFGKIMDNDTTTIYDISPINMLKQFGIVLITFIQGIIQPYWNYKHLKSIDNIIVDKGKLVINFKILYNKLQTVLDKNGFTFFKCPLPDIKNERNATAYAILDSSYFKLALKYVGSVEVLISLANKKNIYPVKWVKSSRPILKAINTFDFQVSSNICKTISVDFMNKSHALLTGPNKGGKSTVLRALSTSALLAHTYGCGLGQLTMTPFNNIFVCLKPDDLPGSKSRFEREIEFTANTINNNDRNLVLIDELYHSTNPPDALRSCEIYCNQLWNKTNTISVISTHLFELVEKADKKIKRICCPAKIDKNNNIIFEYSLCDGICKVSSVDDLLIKNGLLRNVMDNSAVV